MSNPIVTQPVKPVNALAKVAGVPACERDPQYAEDAVREFAERQGWTFAEIARFARGVAQQTPWLAAIAAAAEQLITPAPAKSAPEPRYERTTVTHYRFAPSSHRSRHVKHCRICEKRGRERCPHHKAKAVAK